MRFAYGDGVAGGVWVFSADGLSYSRLREGDASQTTVEVALEGSTDVLAGEDLISHDRLKEVVLTFADNGKKVAGGWIGDDEPTACSSGSPTATGELSKRLVDQMLALPFEAHPEVAALASHRAAARDRDLAAFLAAYAEHGIGDLDLGDWWADPPERISDAKISLGKTPDGHPVIASASGISLPSADDIDGADSFESWLDELTFRAQESDRPTCLAD